MRAVFLSDAHLKGPGDAAYPKLIRFLGRLRGRGDGGRSIHADALVVDHLVIAGDFFDFWFVRGDIVYPGFQPVVERIAVLKQQGVRICLCEGNHDFFLGEYFTGRLGIEVYPEWAEFEIDGLRILVSHGDTVDRGNRKYLALRRFLRSRFARALQRRLPLKLLWRLARLSSEMSKEMSGESQDRLAEIMHRFAVGKFQEGYDAVILGHCHKPTLREAIYDGRRKTFATLGDWISSDSYLSYHDGRFALNRFLPEE
ncbi:MAG: UDP-2,3-diacylglucosamine diphosphatase [Proteobacteria bacterium]|nr:UDP-2,3-diacylglucosamine diphosphatase [Pseudomonadota bacterium]